VPVHAEPICQRGLGGNSLPGLMGTGGDLAAQNVGDPPPQGDPVTT
jgi:hypothetical protein